jgi:hypothetical protein
MSLQEPKLSDNDEPSLSDIDPSLLSEKTADLNEQNCKKYLSKIKNPAPIVIAIIIFGCITIMYFYYILLIKHNLNGLWVDDDNKHHRIKHNLITDNISTKTHNGSMFSKMLILNNENSYKMGIIACDSKSIQFDDNIQWYKK